MGNSAVVVLHYDCFDEIEKHSKRLADAMRRFPSSHKPEDFGFGRVIAWDHSSGAQVCVVYGNTGWRIGMDNDVPERAINAIVDILKWRGYKVKSPPASARSIGDRTEQVEGSREP